MDLQKEVQKALDLGISMRFLASKIDRDHTTLSKWLRGERNISDEVKQDIIRALQELKEEWNNIQV